VEADPADEEELIDQREAERFDVELTAAKTLLQLGGGGTDEGECLSHSFIPRHASSGYITSPN
jgi:hypothetical protein